MRHLIGLLNTPIEEDIYVQPPPEVYQHRPRVIWKLHRALYGLRTSPKMWQEHLHSTLRGLQLQQLKADRCVWVKPNLMVLAYVDDLLMAGTSRGDIIVSGATSTIIQLETLYSSYNTTTTSLSGKAHLPDIRMVTSQSVWKGPTTTAC